MIKKEAQAFVSAQLLLCNRTLSSSVKALRLCTVH